MSVIHTHTHIFSHFSHFREDLAQWSQCTRERIDAYKQNVGNSCMIDCVLSSLLCIHGQTQGVEHPFRFITLFKSVFH